MANTYRTHASEGLSAVIAGNRAAVKSTFPIGVPDCKSTRFSDQQVTPDVAKVDCTKCLAKIARAQETAANRAAEKAAAQAAADPVEAYKAQAIKDRSAVVEMILSGRETWQSVQGIVTRAFAEKINADERGRLLEYVSNNERFARESQNTFAANGDRKSAEVCRAAGDAWQRIFTNLWEFIADAETPAQDPEPVQADPGPEPMTDTITNPIAIASMLDDPENLGRSIDFGVFDDDDGPIRRRRRGIIGALEPRPATGNSNRAKLRRSMQSGTPAIRTQIRNDN